MPACMHASAPATSPGPVEPNRGRPECLVFKALMREQARFAKHTITELYAELHSTDLITECSLWNAQQLTVSHLCAASSNWACFPHRHCIAWHACD